MRKGKMRRVSALEVLQCCSAAVLRTPLPAVTRVLHCCTTQQYGRTWGVGVGVSGGSLQFIKDGVLLKSRYNMCYKQESAPT